MFTKILTIEELKEMYVEMLLNKTDKITKVSDGSVNNAIAYGNAKIGQKILKDVAVIESHIFPDYAYGEYLDNIARLRGISPRFGARQSSTYIRIVGTAGDKYTVDNNIFTSTSGVRFFLEEDFTMPSFGYTYKKVRSESTGSSSNVDALTINKLSKEPSGHKYCINEYAAQYGSDDEDDDTFRKRISSGVNSLSRSSISSLEQAFMKVNENVLKIFHNGVDEYGRTLISIMTVNGIDLSDDELSDINIRCEKFLSLTEMRPTGFSGTNVKLKNVDWEPIDISTRLSIEKNYNSDDVRKQIQIRLNKYLDYRNWKLGQKVEWDDLLFIVKKTPGVKYVNDYYFYPNTDKTIDIQKLPRIRGFEMLDLDGNIIIDSNKYLNPIYYPNDIDFSYQSTVLSQL